MKPGSNLNSVRKEKARKLLEFLGIRGFPMRYQNTKKKNLVTFGGLG